MCRVRAKILVARKLGREQKREKGREGSGTLATLLDCHASVVY